MTGFGPIHPLPGIWDKAVINTAVTLPIGVESYGAYALGAWLTPGTPETARKFAKWSAIGALALGMLGQVAYHVLAAMHATRAPWPVVALVSCLPVVTLGMGAALTHLLRDAPESAPQAVPVSVPGSAPEPIPESTPESIAAVAPEGTPESAESAPVRAVRSAPVRGSARALPAGPSGSRVATSSNARRPKAATPESAYAALLARGELPSVRAIKRDMRVGDAKAKVIYARLAEALETAA
jgi:hypothetical protein